MMQIGDSTMEKFGAHEAQTNFFVKSVRAAVKSWGRLFLLCSEKENGR
jgi:hypothetical protein